MGKDWKSCLASAAMRTQNEQQRKGKARTSDELRCGPSLSWDSQKTVLSASQTMALTPLSSVFVGLTPGKRNHHPGKSSFVVEWQTSYEKFYLFFD